MGAETRDVRTTALCIVVALTSLSSGCGDDSSPPVDAAVDASVRDAGAVVDGAMGLDAGPMGSDAGSPDAGNGDAGGPDAGGPDAGSSPELCSDMGPGAGHTVVLETPVSGLVERFRYPLSGGIVNQFLAGETLSPDALDDPATRVYMVFDWYNGFIPAESAYEFFLYYLHGDCYLQIFMDGVYGSGLVGGPVLDLTEPGAPVSLMSAPLGGGGPGPDDVGDGINVFDITDLATSSRECPAATVRGELSMPFGADGLPEAVYMGTPMNGAIRDMRIVLGRVIPPCE